MITILRNALFLAAFLVLATPVAHADGKAKPLDTQTTMDLEIVGALEGYQALPVGLPLSLYATEAKELRRAFLPAAGASGHTLRQVKVNQDDYTSKIAERRLVGRTNNPDVEADWVRRRKIWKKIEAAIIKRLDPIIRAANKRGETILVEHGVVTYARLVSAAKAARSRLLRHGLLDAKMQPRAPHAKITKRARDTYLKMGATDIKAKSESKSFTGRWGKKGSSWGVVTLKMTSKTKLVGTWYGGKRNRKIRGVMLKDGITARIEYSDNGFWSTTKYKARVSKDGKSIQLWTSYLDSQTLLRR